MPTILMFSPENCPGFNEKARKAYKELLDKLEGLLKKHGGKLVGGWGVTPEHLDACMFG